MNTHSGCKLLIPNLDAKAPAINGSAALPACPNPAIQPTEAVRIHGGSRRLAQFMMIGYIGPRNRPTKDTATASPMRDGTNQMTNSRLGKCEV
jgi:hypothetical protein